MVDEQPHPGIGQQQHASSQQQPDIEQLLPQDPHVMSTDSRTLASNNTSGNRPDNTLGNMPDNTLVNTPVASHSLTSSNRMHSWHSLHNLLSLHSLEQTDSHILASDSSNTPVA